jgi:branched-subunit amino acid transport protein
LAVATFPSRFLPALFIKRLAIGPDVEEALRIIPFCILVSMIAMDVAGDSTVDLQKILAVGAVIVVGWASESVGLSVVSGVAIYTVFDLGLIG